MKVATDVRRIDLLLFNLAYIPHNKFIVIGGPAAAIAFLVGTINTSPFSEPSDWDYKLAFLVLSLVVGYTAVFLGLIVCMIGILLSSKSKGGVLGPHEFAIDENGIHEITPVNEGKYKWQGIHKVRTYGRYITFQISSSLFHIIPKRSFASDQAFQEFSSKSKELWLSAQK